MLFYTQYVILVYNFAHLFVCLYTYMLFTYIYIIVCMFYINQQMSGLLKIGGINTKFWKQ